MARGVRFLLGFGVYPFLRKTGPGIPVLGYCPCKIHRSIWFSLDLDTDFISGHHVDFRLLSTGRKHTHHIESQPLTSYLVHISSKQ